MDSRILKCIMCAEKTIHIKILGSENIFQCCICSTNKKKGNGRGKAILCRDTMIHMKKSKENLYTLCGRKIFSANKKGVRILCTFPTGIQASNPCLSCQHVFKKNMLMIRGSNH